MQNLLLTEGARRALEMAAALAAQSGLPEARPMHLLWALVLDESRAAEALARAGVTLDRLEASAPGSVRLHETPDASSESLMDSCRRALGDILISAAQSSAARDRDAEIGTQDLLVGLAAVESDARDVLARFGVTLESLETARERAAPLGVDFQIRWQSGADDGPGPAKSDWRDRPDGDDLRIIDAAANRAREGLRVLEDFARFALNDGHLTAQLKSCRHGLRAILNELAPEELLRSRDTLADVGTRISTQSEATRANAADVARAAAKRAQEALRSLEEFGKLWSAEAAQRFERLRYDLYTIEKALVLSDVNRRTFEGRTLYFLASPSQCGGNFERVVRGALAGGAGIVQLREKHVPDRRLIEWASKIRDWTREADALFIVNDRPDLAIAAGADGVHLGQDDLPVTEARAIVGPRRLVGVSTHSIEQARRAVLEGADYIGVGPVFSTPTKSFAALAGLEFVRQAAVEVSLPWFAIGGINLENIDAVVEAGARRAAVGHAIANADDSQKAASAFGRRLGGMRPAPAG